ncbi:MAG: LiaF-related protein [Caldisericia bacterium]|nr:LiaF-related protein [Caldisericia bacterium]
MNFFFKPFFWGYLLLGFGVLIILDQFIPNNIPYGTLFWAFLLIALGIQLLIIPKDFRKCHIGTDYPRVKTKFTEDKREENILFGKSTLDYSNLSKEDKKRVLDVSVIFGQGTILINPQDPIQIKASSVFGNITLPDGRSVSFGDKVYETESFQTSSAQIHMKVDVVFGEAVIEEKLP